MKKGTHEAAPMSKAVQGKMDTSKPTGGKRMFGYTAPGRKGKKA